MESQVDQSLRPFDVSGNPEPQRREIAHMLNFWRQGLHRDFPVSGLLSPKFSAKTGLSGDGFADFIRANPGYDVWFINPFPQYHYISFNLWDQGEFFHPGLRQRAERVFAAAGLKLDLASFPRGSMDTLLFCNYWAGTPRFWDRFMGAIDVLAKAADSVPDMLDLAPYNADAKAPYFPFFFERCFTTFLVSNPDIKACPWRYSREEAIQACGTEIGYLFLRDWAPIIDKWDERGVYTEMHRGVFHGIEKFFGLTLTWRHMKERAYKELGITPA